MNEAEQAEPKEIGRIRLSYDHDLIASVVNDKKFRLSIVDKADNKKLELSIVDRCDEGRWARILRILFVYVCVVVFLAVLNFLVAPRFILGVCLWWWLLPAVTLFVGFLVQFLDASYRSLRERCRKKKVSGCSVNQN